MLSPSSRSIDAVLKRELYQQSGVEQYWLVDPDEPSVTVWTRQGDRFGAEQVVARADVVELASPLRVSIRPADLVR